MKKEILYTMSSPYRDDFNIYGYRFGEGKKSLAIVGSIRGDEIQQQYTCAALVKALTELEQSGAMIPGFEVLVIPSVNPFSMNIGKRFWSMDNTDINRMFPGYDKGETTQRVAAGLFESVKDYNYGIQLASYYIPGEFIPHVRMLDTGYQPENEGNYFGLPYVYVKEALPYDTALLNYNWQIWQTKAFSLYAGHTDHVVEENVDYVLQSILRFMVNVGLLSKSVRPGYSSQRIGNADLVSIRATSSGLLRKIKFAQDNVSMGDVLAEIIDPYEGTVREVITSPVNGVIFFSQERPLVMEGARIFQVVEDNMI